MPVGQLRRPALLAAGAFAGGLTVGAYINVPVLPCAAGAAVAAAAAFFVRPRALATVLALAALALGAAAWHETSQRYYPPDSLFFQVPRDYAPMEGVLTGTVADDPESRGRNTVFDLKASAFEACGRTRAARGKVRVTVYEPVPLRYGDRVAVRGAASLPRPSRNPGEFDYRAYLARRGITASMRARDAASVRVLGRGGGDFFRAASYNLKRHAAAILDRSVGGEEGKLLKGLTLGSREEIDPAVMEDFRAAGVVHLIAISGFNVGIVAFVLFLVLRGTRLPRAAANVVVMAFLPAYAVLTGLDPPVVRASVMGVLLLVADLVERDTDVFNALAAAALVILIANPLLIGDLSFQLSFAATASLAAFYPLFRRLFVWAPGWLADTAAGTFAAQLGVMPLQLYYFNRFTPTAFLSNLVMIPLSSLAIILSIITLVTGAVWRAAGEVYGGAAWLAARGLLSLGHVFSLGVKPLWGLWRGGGAAGAPHWADLQFWTTPAAAWLAGAGVAALVALRAKRWRVRTAALAAAAACVGAWTAAQTAQSPDLLRVTFLDVGQADAAVVEFPSGRTMVVDAGYAGGGYDAGARVLAPFLRRRGVNRIDYLCVSHGDADHCGGASFLVRTFPVGVLWYSAAGGRGRAFPTLLAAAEEMAVPARPLPPETFSDGRCRIVRVWPRGAGGAGALEPNDRSTALRLTYGRFSALWTGDLERDGQRLLLGWGGDVRADALKVPHHGSAGAADAVFIGAVNPRLAFVTGKPGNERYPAKETRALYGRAGAAFINAGEHGALVVETDGRRLRARTMF